MDRRCELWARDLGEAGFRGAMSPEAPLAPLTTWKIGGPAELLATPVDRDDLIRLVRYCAEHDVPWRVLGNGSNLLVRDDGVRGVVVRLRRTMDRIEVAGRSVLAGSGAMFPAVAHAAATAGLAGIEFAAGIPGTIGGAVVMNAGWHEYEIGNTVREVEFLDGDSGRVERVPRDSCAFAYRDSAFRNRSGIVLSATLDLAPGDPDEIRGRLDGFAESRKANQPTHLPSCGSVFVQPPGDFAGRLIERAGLKGLRVGSIEVSPLHANFFVNLGGGTASQVLELVGRVEREVEDRFGVRLEREFELW